jgi:predicted TIM-barrel fold metal-dependent hydrolase
VADTPLMSAIFRAYNDRLADFCRTDPARLKGIAMINLDDVPDGIKELERAARLGLSGAMITVYLPRAPALRRVRVRAVLGPPRRRSTCY